MKNNSKDHGKLLKHLLIGITAGAMALLGFQAITELFLLKDAGGSVTFADLNLKNALAGGILGTAVVTTKEVMSKAKKKK